MQANNTPLDTSSVFPFQRLPTEVRHMIYKLVMCKPHMAYAKYNIVGSFEAGKTSTTRSGKAIRPRQLPPYETAPGKLALAFTCRQLYLEAGPIWYANTAFQFRNPRSMQEFLAAIGPANMRAIRYVGLHFENRSEQEGHAGVCDLYNRLGSVRDLEVFVADRHGDEEWQAWEMGLLEICRRSKTLTHVALVENRFMGWKSHLRVDGVTKEWVVTPREYLDVPSWQFE